MSNEHELKCWPEYYGEVEAGRKTFEVRRDDRGFKVGDVLWLKEYEPKSQTYTGRSCRRTVSYITNFGQMPGMVVMALRSIPAEPVAWLQCGGLWGGEIEDWEIDADQKVCERMNIESNGHSKRIPLYAAPPRQPAGELSDERVREIAINAAATVMPGEPFCVQACINAIHTALRESGDAKDARRIEGLEPPFSVYEDYERGLHIIDRTTRIVLSDSYAYDKDEAARASRMEAIAAALNAALSGATHD